MIFVLGYMIIRKKVMLTMSNKTRAGIERHNQNVKGIKSEGDIGVSVIKVYAQIARYGNNPSRFRELQILRKAIKSASGKKHMDYRYAKMKYSEALLCFGEELDSFPKSALVASLKSK